MENGDWGKKKKYGYNNCYDEFKDKVYYLGISNRNHISNLA